MMKTALALVLVSAPAFAQPVTIVDHRCVAADFDRAFRHIIDYDGYSSTPGAKYGVSLSLLGTLPLLNMFYSRGSFLAREGYRTDAYVAVALQPSNLTDNRYYPSFVIRCETASPTPGALDHRCHLVTEVSANGQTRPARRYGLQNFESTLRVTAASAQCPAERPTQLDYSLLLDGNSAEIGEIKGQVLAPAGPLAPTIDKFFVEEDFFRNYYQNFYSGWVRGL